MTVEKTQTPIHRRPVEILQRLIQFDTTNPPGNTSDCVSYINGLLSDAGIESKILTKKPEYPTLYARIPGGGKAPPLLLYGHLDVVTTENQEWQQPPFEGKIVDSYVWGRGALDMKGGCAMMLSAFLRAKSERLELPGDVILVLVSDEETSGEFGAKFLVEEHTDLFEGVRYAIGEFGGFSMEIGNQRFYPIQVAEKQICWMRAVFQGLGGHGSMPVRGGAMAGMADFLKKIDKIQLPVHITPSARLMLEPIAQSLGGISGLLLGQLLNPTFTNIILKLLGERGHLFGALLHNTVSPTILHGSEKVNVIPSVVTVEMDGRLLPGYQPDDMVTELHDIVGEEVDIQVVQFDPGPAEPDMGLFDVLAGILKEADPEGIPVPLMMSGVTDGRFFSKLGIQTYGYLPMNLPDDFNFIRTVHAADERIPVEAVEFGTDAIYKALGRFTA